MSEHKTFELSFSTILEDKKASAKLCFKDNETGYSDTFKYDLCIDYITKYGGEYVDNIAEFLLGKAISRLIEQKKAYRKETLNVYNKEK